MKKRYLDSANIAVQTIFMHYDMFIESNLSTEEEIFTINTLNTELQPLATADSDYVVYVIRVTKGLFIRELQILEYTGQCVAVSEPDSPNFLSTKYQKEGDSPELRQLARDVIRWECRPYPSMQPPPLAYALKLTPPVAASVELFRNTFPNSRFLFMYRDVVKVAKSLYRTTYSWPSVWLFFKLRRKSGFIVKKVVEFMGFHSGNRRQSEGRDDLEPGVGTFCLVMGVYMNLRRNGRTDIVAIRYEDLITNPNESIRRILQHCRLPVELVGPALHGLDVDSQRNSVISKEVIGSLPEPELTPDVLMRANERLRKCGLPVIGEECLVDGTITCENSR